MGLGRSIHNIFFRRASTFFVTIVVTAVFAERTFDHATAALWDRMQRGKLWDHMKGEIEGQQED
uniref:Complex III subunit 9 n=1 Tax=Amphimedon queenslandica TaxID=400682 RepID=A0A1X7UEY6_AMPQE